jgi:hypothetical protein
MPSSGCIATQYRGSLTDKQKRVLMSDLERSLHEISKAIEISSLSDFDEKMVEPTDKFNAVVEYGKLLRDFSESIHFVTRVSVQHRLALDKENVERKLYWGGNNSSPDFSSISSQLESIKKRVEIFEKWVGN